MPYSVSFDPSTLTLVSTLSGVVTEDQVIAWETALYAAAERLAPGTHFHFVDDLRGYEVGDQQPSTHQLMRVVTPRFLADHAFAVGFWQLYGQVPPSPTKLAVCRRVVHIHHDCAKMDRYAELLGSDREAFFCDGDRANAWIGRTLATG